MRSHLVSFFAIPFVLLSSSSYAAKSQTKTKIKNQPAAIVEPSIVEQALQAIAVDPNMKMPHSSSPQETGILVMPVPELNDDRFPTRFPVGFHFDSYSVSGSAIATNKKVYYFSDINSPVVPSVRLGLVPWRPVLFDSYYVQLGYQQKQISADGDQSLRLAHHTATLAGENKFYTRGKMDLRYQIEMGLLQSQISSRENSLSNVTSKSSFVGLGLQAQYQLLTSVNADLEITYRSAMTKSEDYNLQPIGFGAGISYIW